MRARRSDQVEVRIGGTSFTVSNVRTRDTDELAREIAAVLSDDDGGAADSASQDNANIDFTTEDKALDDGTADLDDSQPSRSAPEPPP